jgi:hypothetical protein
VIGLYAIALGAPADGRGAQGEALRVVSCGALQLLTGSAPPPLSADALRAHEAAVRAIADRSMACLPARFGAGAAGVDALARWAAAREPQLLDALEQVRGREQMTIRLHGPATAPAAPAGGPGTRYLEERRRARSVPELDPLRAALADLLRAERVERHEGEGSLLASAYHLIDRGAAPEYVKAVERTALAPLQAKVSGPWPAWAFAPELEP